MPNKPFADGVATDETGAVIVADTILYLLGTSLTLTPKELASWIYDATAYQVQLSTRQIESTLLTLILQSKVAVDRSTSRYTLIREIDQLKDSSGRPLLSTGDTVTILGGHTGTVTRIIRRPFRLGDFLIYVEGTARPAPYSAINSIHIQEPSDA